MTNQGVAITNHSHAYPNLAYKPTLENNKVVLVREGMPLVLETELLPAEQLMALLAKLDGQQGLSQIQQDFPELSDEQLAEFVKELDKNALLDVNDACEYMSGLEALFCLEDTLNELLHEKIYQNKFWQTCTQAVADVPDNVLYGLAIEHYHFLYRQNYFDTPILAQQHPGEIRELMLDFFHEEYRHDKIILKSLSALGFSEADLSATLPLPATLALCNALSYWASNDPLFFFLTLGVLEGKDLGDDTYVAVCRNKGLPEAFIKPIEAHAKINLQHAHGNLTRLVYANISHVDGTSLKRLRANLHLFVEMYDNFYAEIWQHYSNAPKLLRRLCEL